MGSMTTASGGKSTAMGYKTKAESMAETVVGQYNALGTSRDTSWATTDAAFRVGIGTSENDRKDALTVYKDGTVAISGDLRVSGSISSNQGRRLAALEASAEKQQQLKAEIKEQLKAEHEQLKAEHAHQLAEIKEELTQLAVALAKK